MRLDSTGVAARERSYGEPYRETGGGGEREEPRGERPEDFVVAMNGVNQTKAALD